jgi:hypothetical protein
MYTPSKAIKTPGRRKMGVKRRGRRRDEDVLWAPENVGPPSWWWMTEETREVQADERDEDVLWAPEHI